MDFNINNFFLFYFSSKFHNLPKFDGGHNTLLESVKIFASKKWQIMCMPQF